MLVDGKLKDYDCKFSSKLACNIESKSYEIVYDFAGMNEQDLLDLELVNTIQFVHAEIDAVNGEISTGWAHTGEFLVPSIFVPTETSEPINWFEMIIERDGSSYLKDGQDDEIWEFYQSISFGVYCLRIVISGYPTEKDVNGEYFKRMEIATEYSVDSGVLIERSISELRSPNDRKYTVFAQSSKKLDIGPEWLEREIRGLRYFEQVRRYSAFVVPMFLVATIVYFIYTRYTSNWN